LLSERKHDNICKSVMELFPKLFNFQASGLLFMDHAQKELFKIQFFDKNERRGNAEYDSIVYFPCNIGMTAIAIGTNKTMFFDDGNKLPTF